MATARSDRKVRVTMPNGQVVEGTDVPISESSEKWSEVHLEDGTILRIKPVVGSVVRVDGQYDQEDNPVYVVKVTPAITVVDIPEALKKKG